MAPLIGLPRNGNARHRQEPRDIELALCLARWVEQLEAKHKPYRDPDPHQLQLFDDPGPGPCVEDRRQPEPGMSTRVHVARSPEDRAFDILCLAFFLNARSILGQARASDLEAAELIVREGGVNQAAVSRAKTRKHMKSVRGRLRQHADFLIDLVGKMMLQPHFLVLLRSFLPRLPRTYARPGIPGDGL